MTTSDVVPVQIMVSTILNHNAIPTEYESSSGVPVAISMSSPGLSCCRCLTLRPALSQVTCQGSAASRWTLAGPTYPSGGGGGGVLEWAAGGGGGGAEPPTLTAPAPALGAPCPCWHQVSDTGQLALSPQAVEDWMLTKLFFSGRAPCSVAHVQLQ